MEINKESKKVLDKIRKILAKANDPACTQHEMESFLEAANRLSIKHNINSADVELNMNDIGKTEIDSNKGKREDSNYEIHLLAAIAKNYNCKITIRRNARYCFEAKKYIQVYSVYGTNEDVEITVETYKIASEKFRNLTWSAYKQYQKTKKDEWGLKLNNPKISVCELEQLGFMIKSPLWCKSYLAGTIVGLRNKLKKEAISLSQEDKEKWGLIIVGKEAITQEYIDSELGKIGTRKTRKSKINSEAHRNGIIDGESNNNLRLE